MSQINDFLSYIDFEAMREYCMANGKTVHYAKGDYFVEEGQIGKYVGLNIAHWLPKVIMLLRDSHLRTNV